MTYKTAWLLATAFVLGALIPTVCYFAFSDTEFYFAPKSVFVNGSDEFRFFVCRGVIAVHRTDQGYTYSDRKVTLYGLHDLAVIGGAAHACQDATIDHRPIHNGKFVDDKEEK
jgi:hypothetical protein